jgi:hypothetical protein
MPPPTPVALQTLDGAAVGILAAARAAFKGHLRPTPWDAQHLGYFLGYANWNYFTTPFLFEYPGLTATEIKPRHEAGQTWRRIQARFPSSIALQQSRAVVLLRRNGPAAPNGLRRRGDVGD